MRSSKSRSRSKGNRNRSVGNVVNRVFDSSGPEGKVRGTPQQIIDKYNQLARDAQLSNDRVATENFQQHAEHYLRMLAEAQREMQERQQQQGAQNNQNNQQGNSNASQHGSDQPHSDQPEADRQRGAPQDARPVAAHEDNSSEDVIQAAEEDAGGLVETPEDKPKRARRPRKRAVDAAPEPTVTPDAAE